MINKTDIDIEILNALYDGDLDRVDEIISGGIRSLDEITPKENWSWLHRALLGFGLTKMPSKSVKYLIDKNIAINAQDVYGMTPLHHAMRARNADAAIVLLEAGANPNIPNRDGLRPLSMVGYTKERLDVLELMLQKGGNVHHIMGDGTGKTILESKEPDESSPQWKIDIYEMMKRYA
mgnify:FL=1|jgi:hypothetical protein